MRILIVDDKKENLYLLEMLLKGSGYEVVSATNGAEALEKLHTQGFDLIISDILMPVMDGFQLCHEVKKEEDLKGIPFVFYTATYTNKKDEEFALQLGADLFIRKPMEPEKFIEIIRGVRGDVKEGKIKPREPTVKGEEETYRLYSERLVKKLEQKMLDLEKAYEHIEHINSVLKAIRTVNQLIIVEKDRDSLLQKACDILLDARGYDGVWLGFLSDGKNFATVKGSGFEEALSRFRDDVVGGDLPPCIRNALAQEEKVVIVDRSRECKEGCVLKNTHVGKEAAIVCVEHAGKLFGLLAVLLAPAVVLDEEEKGLLIEVAGDLGLALHSMEIEEARKRAEEALQERVKELNCLYGLSQLVEKPGISLDEIFQGSVDLIPSALRYPEITCVRITLDDQEFKTENFRETNWKQSSSITLRGERIGTLDVCYLEERPQIDAGPFLKEEISLLDALAERLGRIIERKRMGEALRESEVRYRMLFEGAAEGILVADTEAKKFRYANPAICTMLGYPEEELKSLGVSDIHPKEDLEWVISEFEAQVRREKTLAASIPCLRKDGTVIYVDVNTTPIVIDGRESNVGFFTDITERKRLADERERHLKELELKNAEMVRFVYTISHELRTPLVTLQGYTDLLRRDIERNEQRQVETDLAFIENAVTSMGRLLEDTLELSRTGRVMNPPEDVPFGVLIRDALAHLADQIKLSGVEVSVAAGFPTVHVDRMQVEEVLVNLIENGIKFMGDQPHPKIEIGSRTEDKETVFFVKDNGTGLDESQLEKVFELFYKVDRSSKGTGAGLAIVKRIIEVHGGRIWIESEKGKGCTVYFTLPVV
ncbi:MAG: response regulator [Methanomicrobia archaeon]|nr:response regulator [Methanomicrobia archaeon]